MTINKMWDLIIENEIATEEELDLVTKLIDLNEDILNEIVYVRTGYHSLNEYLSKDKTDGMNTEDKYELEDEDDEENEDEEEEEEEEYKSNSYEYEKKDENEN